MVCTFVVRSISDVVLASPPSHPPTFLCYPSLLSQKLIYVNMHVLYLIFKLESQVESVTLRHRVDARIKENEENHVSSQESNAT